MPPALAFHPFRLHWAYTFSRVKRWFYFALAAVVVAGAVYAYSQLGGPGLGSLISWNSSRADGSGSPGQIQWHRFERPGDGFKVDLPSEPRDLQAPAYNEAGGSEPIRMIVASPDGDVTFAVTWQDNPPVARIAQSAERTLNLARDGMLARTETTILSESRGFYHDYPSVDVLARNTGGGILNARLIMAENRLYTLMALFPTASARGEHDVNHFFDSFVPARPSTIPETLPSAAQ